MSAVYITIFLVMVCAYVWSVLFNVVPDFKDVPLLVTAIFAIVAPIIREKRKAKPFRLTPSFYSGVSGGFVGGIIAGLLIGILGASVQAGAVILVLQVVACAALGGALLGGSIQLVILWFRHLEIDNQYPELAFNEASGGFVGGAIGGLIVGLFEMAIFGQRKEPFVGIVPLVPGALFGVTFIALGALFYDYRGKWRNVISAFVTYLLLAVGTAAICIIILQLWNVEALVESGLGNVYKGGAILGGVIGAAAGLQVGLTLLFYRLRESESDPG